MDPGVEAYFSEFFIIRRLSFLKVHVWMNCSFSEPHFPHTPGTYVQGFRN